MMSDAVLRRNLEEALEVIRELMIQAGIADGYSLTLRCLEPIGSGEPNAWPLRLSVHLCPSDERLAQLVSDLLELCPSLSKVLAYRDGLLEGYQVILSLRLIEGVRDRELTRAEVLEWLELKS